VASPVHASWFTASVLSRENVGVVRRERRLNNINWKENKKNTLSKFLINLNQKRRDEYTR
jgi:hypothetical protein